MALPLFIRISAWADENLLTELLDQHSYEIRLSETGIEGPGGEFIFEESANAQFVVIGECHNVREIPPFASALFSVLHKRYGFDYFATEHKEAWQRFLGKENPQDLVNDPKPETVSSDTKSAQLTSESTIRYDNTPSPDLTDDPIAVIGMAGVFAKSPHGSK